MAVIRAHTSAKTVDVAKLLLLTKRRLTHTSCRAECGGTPTYVTITLP